MSINKHPLARNQGIVIQALPDETLVYDLKSQRAHCLNLLAAMVWERCDGRASAEEIASSISEELRTTVDTSVVLLALDQLSRAELVSKPAVRAESISRRELVRRLGVGVSLPLVSSIIAPPAQAAASCTPGTQGCSPPGVSCSSNLQCCSCSCLGGTCQ